MGSNKRDVLFENNTTVTESNWHGVGAFESFVLIVSGMVAGDILQLFGTNDDILRQALVNEEQIGADITADGVYQISSDGIPAFVRLKRTDISGAGSVDASFNSRL